jgi:RNase P subunit RPR2
MYLFVGNGCLSHTYITNMPHPERRNSKMNITTTQKSKKGKTCVSLTVTGYTFSVGNNVSQVTRMAHIVLRCTMCHVVWIKMWSYKENFTWQIRLSDDIGVSMTT